MATYRLDIIRSLARQLVFAPADVRIAQLAAAETLLGDLNISTSYPVEFIVYRITGYHRKGVIQAEQLTGLALFHDIGVLLEEVSDSLQLVAAEMDEPVLSIDDVTERFNVTSKTIQRWRRKGLVSRRFVFADGKKRVGFLLSSIERFIARHTESVVSESNLLPLTDVQKFALHTHAIRLIAAGLTQADITRRLARRFNRSPLTVLHTLRKLDQSTCGAATQSVWSDARTEPKASRRAKMIRLARRQKSVFEIARRLHRPAATVYRILMDDRISRATRKKVRFHDDPLYHDEDAAASIDRILAAARFEQPAEDVRVPKGLPPYFADLFRTPLLTRSVERALFLKFHYLKFRFATARRRFDAETARHREVTALEKLQRAANEVKNDIVRANLRLVVSVARKHVGPVSGLKSSTPSLMDLVSEGNLILMRAAESFDIHKNVRFSTYATLALMKGFARLVPALRASPAGRLDLSTEVADQRGSTAIQRLSDRDEVRRLMQILSTAERTVIARQFGIEGQPEPTEVLSYERLGSELGLSKHRVRALEQSALCKLRGALAATRR